MQHSGDWLVRGIFMLELLNQRNIVSIIANNKAIFTCGALQCNFTAAKYLNSLMWYQIMSDQLHNDTFYFNFLQGYQIWLYYIMHTILHITVVGDNFA